MAKERCVEKVPRYWIFGTCIGWVDGQTCRNRVPYYCGIIDSVAVRGTDYEAKWEILNYFVFIWVFQIACGRAPRIGVGFY
jgi:hypothetical protein